MSALSGPDLATVSRLTAAAGLGRAGWLVPLPGGRNNRVYRVQTDHGPAVLKVYFRHPDDPRDRLAAEWGFLRFVWSAGMRCVPQPLAYDPAAGWGLYEWVEGRAPEAATAELVAAAADFVRRINAARERPEAARLPIASEAVFSLAEHLRIVAKRVARLTAVTDLECAAFVRNELVPAWEAVSAVVRNTARSIDRVLAPAGRCVSPSDFGFHNARVGPCSRVFFLDFEYAGWDDPAKLIADFFCQPAVPVPAVWFDDFAAAVAATFPDPPAVAARARLLWPVYQIKWVCIRLNEFVPVSGQRRAFALSAEMLPDRRRAQLAAARLALRRLLPMLPEVPA